MQGNKSINTLTPVVQIYSHPQMAHSNLENRREWYKKTIDRRKELSKIYRKNNPERMFLIDARSQDKKRSRENNLTLEFVEKMFEEPCTYCGTTEIPPSLDRIDNDKGHTIGNVVPCCQSCNYMRRDIPYDAWLIIAKAVRECHEKGLLNNYDAFARLANNRSKYKN